MKSALTMGTVGTFNYTAPEMMRSPNYDEKVGPLAAGGGFWQSFWSILVSFGAMSCCYVDCK